jgi:hypothetical protein
LAAVYKKYESQGFHIVGIESQGTADSDIVSLCKGKGVEYQISASGRLKGSTGQGIPRGYLFGPDGKFVAEVHPGQLEPKVKELIKEVAGAMAGPGPYVKLANLAGQVKAGQGLGTVLKTLRTKKDSKDEAEAAEAKMMLEHLGGIAQGKLDRALELKTSDPASAVKILDKLSTQFTGDDIAKTAKTESDTLKKDPKVKKEMEGEVAYLQLEAVYTAMKPFQGAKNPKADGFQKLNAQAIASLVGGCQTLVKRCPDTIAAKKATELMEQFKP